MKRFLLSSLLSLVLFGLLFFVSSVEAGLSQIVVDDFNTYEIGSVVGQGDWASYARGENFIVQDSVAFDDKKALYNNFFGDSVVTKTGEPLPDGRQAVYVRTENRLKWGSYADGNTQVRISKGQSFASSIFAAVSFKGDGNVAYYDPIADVYRNFDTYDDNEWTLLEIEWRSSDKKARYRVNKGEWTQWQSFRGSGSFTDFDNIGFDFVLPSGSGGVYFDALH